MADETQDAAPEETAEQVTEAAALVKAELEKSQASFKAAVEDRKLLRRHCKRLEAEGASFKSKIESLEAASAAEAARVKSLLTELEAQLESALEDRKLLRRHVKTRDESAAKAEAAAVEAATLKEKVSSLELRLADMTTKADKAETARVDLERRALVDKKEADAERRETLRDAQLVIAALKEEVSRLRSALTESETKTITERARAEAARDAAVNAARAAELSDESHGARLKAVTCEIEAAHAEELRRRDERIRNLEAATRAAVNEAAARARADAQRTAREEASRTLADQERVARAQDAENVVEATRLFLDVVAASNAAFQAAKTVASSTAPPPIEEPPVKEEVVQTKPKKKKQMSPAPRHKWRTETLRAAFGDGPVGLHVTADRNGLRVTRVRGAALAAGAAAGDYVRALNGEPIDVGTTELDFADMVGEADRPLTIDLEREVVDVPTKKPPPAPVADADGWREESVRHPCPSFGVFSPVVQRVLQQWSTDTNKLQYVRLWLGVATNVDGNSSTAPAKFPRGLQLAGLRREVLDGFLTLVVPLLRRSRGDKNVMAKTRLSSNDSEKWDLAIRVDIPEPAAQPASSSRQSSTSIFSALGAAPKRSSPPPDNDPAEQARRTKLANQRRKAVEEKLAKMRDAHR